MMERPVKGSQCHSSTVGTVYVLLKKALELHVCLPVTYAVIVFDLFGLVAMIGFLGSCDGFMAIF